MSKRDYTGDTIFNLLESQGKIQQQLADALGVTKSQVSEWSRGVTKSYKNHLNEIADYLGVSTDYLLGKEQKDKPTNNGELISAFAIETVKKLDGLSDEGLAKIADYIDFVRLQEKSDKK